MERIALNKRTHHMLQCKNKKKKQGKKNKTHLIHTTCLVSSKCQEDAAVQSDLKRWRGTCSSSGSQLPCGITQCVRVCREHFSPKLFCQNMSGRTREVHSCAISISPKGPHCVLYCVRYCFSANVSYNPVGIYRSVHHYPLWDLYFCMHLSTIFVPTSKNT